ncbi:MAG: hypothetical protein B6U76_06580 [Desulfurococcales archaeon ex4484_217_2]|nr:MAG: hypothetical protein B6U76_06580 [Desulfurococcales archaeon ex4484_217_2]
MSATLTKVVSWAENIVSAIISGIKDILLTVYLALLNLGKWMMSHPVESLQILGTLWVLLA